MPKQVIDKQRRNSEGRARRLANLKPFKKGVSGNPAGRPKSVTLSESYRKALALPCPNDPQGRTYAEVIAAQIVASAVTGEVTSAKELADRTEGRPRQMLEIDATLRDWRQMAQANGLSESDVINEARLLIESTVNPGDVEPDLETPSGRS